MPMMTSGASISASDVAGRRIIASGYSGNGWKEIADLTWPAMRSYGRVFGIPFAAYVGRGDFGRPASWRKLIYIADCFATADEVLWLDADVAIVDSTKNIFDEFPRDTAQGMARHPNPDHWNMGVWLIRRQMLPVLMEAAMQDHCIHDNWWEQRAMNELTARFNIPTRALGEEWNCWVGSPADVSPRFRHACGPIDKVSLLKEWLKK